MGDAVVPVRRLDRVTGGAEGHAGTDHGAVAHGDPAEIEEVAALVDEDPLAERDVQPVVAVERRVDRDRAGQRPTEDLAEQGDAPLDIAEWQQVEPRGQVHDLLHPRGERP